MLRAELGGGDSEGTVERLTRLLELALVHLELTNATKDAGNVDIVGAEPIVFC